MHLISRCVIRLPWGGSFFFIDLYSRFFINSGLRFVVCYYISSRHVTPKKVILLYPINNPTIPWHPGCLTTCVQPSTGASTAAPNRHLVFVCEAVVTNEVGWTRERTERGRVLFRCQFESMLLSTILPILHVDSIMKFVRKIMKISLFYSNLQHLWTQSKRFCGPISRTIDSNDQHCTNDSWRIMG